VKEFEFIDRIRRLMGSPRRPILLGAGDDGAILAGSGRPQVVTTDSQIEGVHFRLDWQRPAGVGARAVEITISDLAAMGARPRALFVALVLPATLTDRSALELVRGLVQTAKQRGCPVAGGNVAVCAGPLALTLTAIGELPAGRKPLLRSSARAGDSIFVTGIPGMARLGLETLLRGARPATALARAAVKRYREPRACFEEVEFLVRETALGAVIDVSDGLAGDLGHVLAESCVGAELVARPAPAYVATCSTLGLDPDECWLGPSDDYELLFTARGASLARLPGRFKARFRRELILVGRVTEERGLWLARPGERRRRVETGSYEHTFGAGRIR
jgi:thiamine-monophosphate kinase